MDSILQDILRILEFFNANNPKSKISKVYIIGTAGKIKGIENYFSGKLNLEVKALKILRKVSFSKAALKLKTRQNNFINCFGAHSLKGRMFYFIKEDLKFKRVSLLLKPKFHKFAICGLLILGILATLKINSLRAVTDQIEIYEQYINANIGIETMLNKVSSKQSEVTSQQNRISSIGNGLEANLELLNIVDNSINEVKTDALINITKYRLQKNSLEIRGRIELPIGITQLSPNYYEYLNVPFQLKDIIKNKLGKDIEVNTSAANETAIDFTIKFAV